MVCQINCQSVICNYITVSPANYINISVSEQLIRPRYEALEEKFINDQAL